MLSIVAALATVSAKSALALALFGNTFPKPTIDLFGPPAVVPCVPGQDQDCNFDDAWACSIDWYVQGLATMGTLGISNYIEELFTMACVRHDGCYRHGLATYGLTRLQCDDIFYKDMKDECPDISDWEGWVTLGISVGICESAARTYYEMVRHLGESRYHKANTSTICYYDYANENARVYAMRSDGKFGNADQRYLWSNGWTVATSYTAESDDNLFMLKTGNGRVHVHRPVASGAVGRRIDNHNWTDGWTNAKGFTVGKDPYLLLLKTYSGRAQIRHVSKDGVGSVVKDYNWSDGWTITEFYQIGGHTYLLLGKGLNLIAWNMGGIIRSAVPRGNGKVKIYQMNNDGTLGGLVTEYSWSAGWSIVKPYTVKNRNFLFRLKTDNGTAAVHELNSNGAIGQQIRAYDWSDGWTTAEFYETNGETYLALMKVDNGTTKVYHMNEDGTVGQLVREYDRRSGWTSLVFYRVSGQLFGIMVRASAGGS